MENRMQPFEVVGAFISASRAGDEAAARGLATAAGWASDGDSAKRAFRNLRKDLLFHPLDVGSVRGDRYVLPGMISSLDQQRKFGDLYFLLRKEDDAWRLEGAVKGPLVAGMFALELVSGVPSWRDLPESPEALSWGQDALSRLAANEPGLGDTPVAEEAGPRTRACLDDCIGRTGSIVGAVACAPLQRAMVGLSFPKEGGVRPDERWMIFDRDGDEGPFVLHSHSPFGSLEALLVGAGGRLARLALANRA